MLIIRGVKKKMVDAWFENPQIRSLVPMLTAKAVGGIQSTFLVPRIYGGKVALSNTTKYIDALLQSDEKRALIITDSFTERYAKRVGEYLDIVGIEYKVWSGALPEVPYHTIEEGAQICEEYQPRVIIAIGGGSVMDTAKVVLIKYDKPKENLFMVIPLVPSIGLRKKFKFFIAIPTTSGTGSEVTTVSVMTDESREPEKKIPVVIGDILPDIAVLDPYFVKDMPPFLTMGTGLDAFAHSMGAYVSNMGSPLTDAINIGAIKEIVKFLPRACKNGAKDMEARAHMQLAATMAGMGFGNSTTGMGVDHSLGHSFGKVYKVHHGVSVGLFLVNGLAFQAKILDRWKDLAPIFEVELTTNNREKSLNDFLQAVIDFIHSVGGPTCVKELKNPVISKEEYFEKINLATEIADNQPTTLGSSRPLIKKHIKRIFEYTWDGKIVDF